MCIELLYRWDPFDQVQDGVIQKPFLHGVIRI